MGIVTACAYVGYVPQIIRLLKTKQSKDISIFSWVIWIFSCSCGLVYSILLTRAELIISYASELILSLIILYLIVVYRKNDINTEQ